MRESESDHRVIAIIDDDEALRDALTVLITAAGWGAVAYACAEEFIDSPESTAFSCALVDIRLPGMGGMQLFHLIRERSPELPVIILTGHGDVPMAVESLKAGAVDFIEKPFDPSRLFSSLREALDRSIALRENKALIKEVEALSSTLTPRERAVMDLIILGKSNKVIAGDLGISPRTIELHRARVMEKMHVRSTAELVRLTGRVPDPET
ncbi:MAG: response regulator [Rhodospirillaceae bacterium]